MRKIISLLMLFMSGALLADPGPIRLRDFTLDPAAPSITAKGEKLCAPDRNGRFQYLIQPEKNFTNKERAALEDAGIAFIGFVPPNAYIVLAAPENLQSLEKKHALLYVSEYLPEYKNGLSVGRFFSAGSEVKLNIILTSPDYAADFLAFLKEEGAKEVSLICDCPPIVRAVCGVGLVDKLILRSDVFSVEEEVESRIMNNAARSESLMNVDAMNTLGYTGEGIMVCVADTGLDSGDPNDIHPDFQNKDVIGVVASKNTERTDWRDLNGHGTHVSGSAVGTGAHENGTYAGTAPEASLYFICIGGNSSSVYPPEMADMGGAYDSGARVMNNSWGAYSTDIAGKYTTSSLYYDVATYNNPDFLILFAAGNSNKKIDTENNCTLSTQAAAKNVLTVGAAESYRPDRPYTYGSLYSNVAAPFNTDLTASPQNGTQQGMAYFSSRGPARDGRYKPDIVAPGTQIISTESLWDSKNNGTRSSYYTVMEGTSMATPLTTGAAADAMQFLIEQGFTYPSSSLVKALLINGARNMGTGQYDNYTEIPAEDPNGVNGFGHIDLAESLRPENGRLFLYDGVIDDTDCEKTYVFTKSVSGPVSATLVWNDYPGTVGAELALINDLDITVSNGKDEYYCDGSSEHCDSINNVERFRSNAFPAGGNIEITVKGYNVMQGPQTFSLAVSGMDSEVVPEPAFALISLLIALFLGRKTK